DVVQTVLRRGGQRLRLPPAGSPDRVGQQLPVLLAECGVARGQITVEPLCARPATRDCSSPSSRRTYCSTCLAIPAVRAILWFTPRNSRSCSLLSMRRALRGDRCAVR